MKRTTNCINFLKKHKKEFLVIPFWCAFIMLLGTAERMDAWTLLSLSMFILLSLPLR